MSRVTKKPSVISKMEVCQCLLLEKNTVCTAVFLSAETPDVCGFYASILFI